MGLSFDQKLDNYADLAVRVGVNLQPGQRLMIRAPVAAAMMVRRLAERAYRAGSRLVDVMWNDDKVSRLRFELAPEDSLEAYPLWRAEGIRAAVDRGDAFLNVLASDPEAFKGIDSARIATARKVAQEHLRPFIEKIRSHEVAWSIVAAPVPEWAAMVFPAEGQEQAEILLWSAILAATRADQAEPVARWQEHLGRLHGLCAHLDARRYHALHFQAPGVDLRVGLAPGHRWVGGGTATHEGVAFVPNLPTEEVFTAPHRDRVDGVVVGSRPLSYQGQLIEDLSLRFEGGRVVEAHAKRGESALRALLATDEGASRLGEVALVSVSSPIARLGVLFYETLFDENAASHLALGSAYRINLSGSATMSAEETLAAGLNDSLSHVDFMIGSQQMDVDGLFDDGRLESLMRAGEWAF